MGRDRGDTATISCETIITIMRRLPTCVEIKAVLRGILGHAPHRKLERRVAAPAFIRSKNASSSRFRANTEHNLPH